MELYFAGEYIFTGDVKADLGMINNRLLSFDYQRKFVDTLVEWRDKMNLFLAGSDKFARKEISMYLYFVGPEKAKIMGEMTSHKSNMLFNYLDGKRATDIYKEQIKPASLFIDSGAFSAWTKGSVIDVDEYISWLNERSEYIDLCGQVDSIPGDRVYGATSSQVREAAEATWENYLYMRERMKNPDALLYTFHVGEPIEFLERALEWTDESGKHIPYMALGGMVGKPHHIRDTFLEKCFITIRKSSNPNIKIHAFGMTDFDLLEKYPIYSADSTSWIMIGAVGNVMCDVGVISVSNNQKNDPKHYSHLPKDAIDKFNATIAEFGFTLDELAEERDSRILFNAMYMSKKVQELNNKQRKFTYRKKLF